MLTKNKKQSKRPAARSGRVAIIASRYNARFVDSMVRAARKRLLAEKGFAVSTIRVPGAFEIPVVAARLAARGEVDAIICLGVIIRGATSHAQHIGEAVTQALATIQVEHVVPVIHEVLLLENLDQARERCLESRFNRGVEAANTALEMVQVIQKLGKSED